ncbi:MAG: hypothetical protein LUG55_07230, partial [Clostridiales bacterium]|nr:hypothetical protein [Clostridiales bacterium]
VFIFYYGIEGITAVPANAAKSLKVRPPRLPVPSARHGELVRWMKTTVSLRFFDCPLWITAAGSQRIAGRTLFAPTG